MPEARTDWSATVRLPKTDFPMKGDLAKREPELLKAWEDGKLWERLREKQKGRPEFLFHDGPPYANGHIHIGHAQNKILKDLACKTNALLGRATPFTPGWDCHGLPIETALLKEMKMSKRGVTDIPKFRRDAAAFAERFIDIQRAEFKRLGVFADWEHPYKTLTPRYEGAIVGAFRRLASGGHVYRGLKPVFWCVTCETALAEAEVEYKDKNSPSVHVALRIADAGGVKELEGASLVIWTTTPWTLPSNMAAALSPDLSYAVVEADGRRFVVAEKLVEALAKASGLALKTAATLKGAALKDVRYAPLFATKTEGPIGRVVLTDYVSAEDGTGIVHTAPAHGEDDFSAAQANGLQPIINIVGPDGRLSAAAPASLAGKHIFQKGEASDIVMAELAERGQLLAKATITHSYPHCWRCKNPVIFRSTEQWFLKVSDALRGALVGQIEATRWVPAEGKNRIGAMVKNRPDWCISRQRVWGTPIPVLYSAATGEAVTDDAVLAALEKKTAEGGTDFWFEKWGETLTRADWPFLPDHPALSKGFKRESDILDVWLDSGVSWLAVLGEDAVADLYLEGSDQHRGWFQSSLVMSTALRGKAPYRTVLTHGFVLDEKGHAMHKSSGNVVAPQEVIAKWGADVLRLWVALADVHEDTRISDKLLEGPAESYRRVRNTLRFMLGNLADFRPSAEIPFEKLPELERFMLYRLHETQTAVLEDYKEYRYRSAARRLVDFCSFDLSANFLDVTKDRLYTFAEDSLERRAAQTVMAEVFGRLCSLLSPILSFTAEEAWRFWADRPAESVFLWDLPAADPRWNDAGLVDRWTKAMEIKAVVQKSLEEMRGRKEIGASLQAELSIQAGAAYAAALEKLDLAEFFIVSKASVAAGKAETFEVKLGASAGKKCPRCWRWQADVGSVASQPELCARCARQL